MNKRVRILIKRYIVHKDFNILCIAEPISQRIGDVVISSLLITNISSGVDGNAEVHGVAKISSVLGLLYSVFNDDFTGFIRIILIGIIWIFVVPVGLLVLIDDLSIRNCAVDGEHGANLTGHKVVAIGKVVESKLRTLCCRCSSSREVILLLGQEGRNVGSRFAGSESDAVHARRSGLYESEGASFALKGSEKCVALSVLSVGVGNIGRAIVVRAVGQVEHLVDRIFFAYGCVRDGDGAVTAGRKRGCDTHCQQHNHCQQQTDESFCVFHDSIPFFLINLR